MKKYLLIIGCLLLSGFTYPEKPVTRVNDYANTLSATEQKQLIVDLKKIETATGAQVAVVIFLTIEENSIEDVANTLYKKWKLGSAEKHDGVLLVLAMKERKMRIEVGYGLEGVLTDAVANGIVRNTLKPRLKAGSVFKAVQAFSADVLTVLTTHVEAPKLLPPKTPTEEGFPFGLVFGGLGVLGILIFLFKKAVEEKPTRGGRSRSSSSSYSSSSSSRSKSSDDDDDSIVGAVIGGLLSGGGSSSSSGSDWGGGSDSGFSGGGGDSGGGGSSGDW